MTAADQVAAELAAVLGPGNVLGTGEQVEPYRRDATATLLGDPRLVVLPGTTEEVAAVVRIAAKHRAPIVPRGAGTGLSGGAVPPKGSIVVCLSRMDKVLEVDDRNFTLRAQAGAVTKAVQDAAAKAGLFYPPDPGSMAQSTIGGNVAENAGGLHGLKYGVTGDYVMGLEVVLADGAICRLGGKCAKDVAGYDLLGLFVGSEGTLGIVTEVLLRLVPRPAARQTFTASFAKMDSAAEAVSAVLAARLVPCTMEFMDRRTIRAVEEHTKAGLPTDAEALLLLEFDGHPAEVKEDCAKAARLCREGGAKSISVARDAAEADALASARRTAFTALAAAAPAAILEDATVPRTELGAMIRFIQVAARRHRLDVATFGHFGDGNLHPTFLADPRNPDEMGRVAAAKREIFEKALELGGTITGEHGIGMSKKAYLGGQLGAAAMGL
ncbi:MAG TPA: FAD-linked oxidase C-terminal domain-containing protein, partial [Opitutaceae bacterium]